MEQTGLSGRFDFTLEFTLEPKVPPPPGQDVQPDGFPTATLQETTTLEEALHKQFGLKLKPVKAPLDTLIVDHAERPSEN